TSEQFESPPDVERLGIVVESELGDVGAAARPHLDQPVGRQDGQGLVNRSAADVELPRDLVYLDLAARWELLLDDAFAQHLIDGVRHSLRANGLKTRLRHPQLPPVSVPPSPTRCYQDD